MPNRLRWVAIGVFMLANTLSFLDRNLLSAVAPGLRGEFGMSNEDYGNIVGAFSLAYAFSAPVAGWFLDKAGLNLGISIGLALWSAVGIVTGFTTGYWSLFLCRIGLGVAESANIPAGGKAIGLYLEPRERAIGAATGQLGITAGSVGATLLAGAMTPLYGWRSSFIVAGALGFLWIPLWIWVSRAVPPRPQPVASSPPPPLRSDRRYWGLIFGTIFGGMTVYSLWTNWTTLFLTHVHHLPEATVNLYHAWLPPVFSAFGAFTGGALSARLGTGTTSLVDARLKAILVAAAALLVTCIVPLLPTAALATAGICWSFFWAAALSANLYALPVDYFGAARAASGVAALTFAYGIMQAILSRYGGRAVDLYGYGPLCAVAGALPLVAWAILRATSRMAPVEE